MLLGFRPWNYWAIATSCYCTGQMIAHHEVVFDTPSVRHAFGPCGVKDPRGALHSGPQESDRSPQKGVPRSVILMHLPMGFQPTEARSRSLSVCPPSLGMELISRPANMIRIISYSRSIVRLLFRKYYESPASRLPPK